MKKRVFRQVSGFLIFNGVMCVGAAGLGCLAKHIMMVGFESLTFLVIGLIGVGCFIFVIPSIHRLVRWTQQEDLNWLGDDD